MWSLMEVVVINGLDMHPVYVKLKKKKIDLCCCYDSKKCSNEMLLNLCGWDSGPRGLSSPVFDLKDEKHW